MTVLSAMQSAAIRLVGRKPPTFFGTTNQFELEIVDLLNEAATDICKSHDWQALTKTATITGNGVDASFPLPDDYDRMVLASDMASADSWFWGYDNTPDMNTWISIQNGAYAVAAPGWWILLNNAVQFSPVPASGAVANYPYISKNFALPNAGSATTAFNADTDTFVLDERLLTLALIWRWREQKRLDVAGELGQFEKAFSEAAARDRGSRVIRSTSRVRRPNVSVGWPWPLG